MKMLFAFKMGGGKALLMLLLLSAAGMAFAQEVDDKFLDDASGLYFQISSTDYNWVRVTYPGDNYQNWPDGTNKPTGQLNIPTSVTYLGTDYTVNQIGNHAFYGNTGITGNLVIPESILTIGTASFRGCTGLNGTLTIGSRVYNIGQAAFYGCNQLTGDIVIPNAVETIGAQSFDFCSGFDGTITFGNSVQTIGNYAFYGCTNLTGGLAFPNTLTSIGVQAFYGCSGLNGTLDLGTSIATISNEAFRGCSGLTGDIIIPNSVTTIGDRAFYNCIGFTGQLVLGNSVQTIGEFAFTGQNSTSYTGLNIKGSLTLPNTITSIGQSAFYNTSGLNGTLMIPREYKQINAYTFRGCGFETVILPNTMDTIGAYALPITVSKIIVEKYGEVKANANAFSGLHNASATKVYIPYGTFSSYYSGKTGWTALNYFSNQNRVSGTNVNWSEATWTLGHPATEEEVVCIFGSVILDEDASPLYVYYASSAAANKITIPDGYTLAPTYGIRTFQYTNMLYIEEGGQLVNPCNYTFGTVKREINGYVSEKDNYYFIASPLTNDYNTSTTNSNITSGTYDLYSYDEPTHYWWNAESSDHNFTKLSNGQGYLYANENTLTLSFIGQFQPSTAPVSVEVTANASSLKGFNLVGNPYTHSISPANLKIGTATVASIYKIEGEEVVIAQNDNAAVMPAEGFFIKTTNGGTLTFNNTGAKRGHISDLNIEVRRANSEKLLDRAYINFYESENIDKFSISDNSTKLYIHHKGDDLSVLRHTDENETAISFEASENATYTISVKPEYVDLNYLHLIDNLTGVETDLLVTPSYTFTAKTTDYASRFRLVFSANNVNETVENANFAYFNGSEWVINASENATVQIMDMMGRVVGTANNCTISTTGISSGMYMLRLIDGNDVKTQKIIVK